MTITSRQVHDRLIDDLDRATNRYLFVRASAKLPRNQGVRKRTKLRRETAERLAAAREQFWAAWFKLPECDGDRGRGWVGWVRTSKPITDNVSPLLFSEEDHED